MLKSFEFIYFLISDYNYQKVFNLKYYQKPKIFEL